MKLSDGIKIEITKECDDCKLCNITEHPEYLTRCKLGLDVAIGYLSYAPGPNCPGPITMHLIPAAVAESHDRERELMLAVCEAAKDLANCHLVHFDDLVLGSALLAKETLQQALDACEAAQ